MRVFIAVLFLIFSLQSWTKADDIRDLQIEGISIGDSLLDYLTKDEIKKELNNDDITFFYKNNTFASITTFYALGSNFVTYEDVGVVLKPDDKNFIIHGLEGTLSFEDKDINKCYKKQISITAEIIESGIISNLKKTEWMQKENVPNHLLSIRYFELVSHSTVNGQFRIICYDLKDGEDLMYVAINSKEFVKFLNSNY